jgi:anaerobic magnesium-protoporphyrin IX monomethyl ester cyclase
VAISSEARVLLVRLASWSEIKKAHPENVMAPLELGWAVSLLERRGHRATLVDTETGAYTEADVQRAVREGRPDVVVIVGITTAMPSVERLGRYVRAALPGAYLVAAGQHATARPGDLLGAGSPFDACLAYEYEETIAELVDARMGGAGGGVEAVPGVVLPDGRGGLRRTAERPLREDLDALPFPRHELFMRDEYTVFHPTDVTRRRRWGFLMASRGCPYPCLYCSPTLRNSYGRAMRWRSAENVVDEMAHLARLGCTVLHFKDDIFTVNRARTLALCDAIRARGLAISWTAQTRADCVDEPLLRAMRAAGCCTVSMGIESGSPRVLEVLRKRETVEDAVRAAEAARAAGLHLVCFFLLGNPTETMDDMLQTLGLARRLDPDILQVGFFTPYPGSPYYEETYRERDRHGPEEFSHYNRVINVSAVPTAALLAFQRRFYLEVVLRPRFVARFAGNRARGAARNLGSELRFLRLSGRFLFSSLKARLAASAAPR